jgi:hypothetical protein
MKSRIVLLLLLVICLIGMAQSATVLSKGTKVKVRTDTKIPAKPTLGAVYNATVSQDVLDNAGQIAVPRGSSSAAGRPINCR